MIVSLSDVGVVSCSYLGTDPSLSVVPVAPESKEINYDEMDEELKQALKDEG